VPLDVDHLAMVQKQIQDGRRYDRITEELFPAGEALVRRNDGRALLIAVGSELKKEIRLVAGDREIADLINDYEAGVEIGFALAWLSLSLAIKVFMVVK